MTDTTFDDALAVLRQLVGSPAAVFHDGQLEAIEQLVDEHRRALVVQRTGWGKSAVYFVATMLLRARGAGPTVLVSPLLALMRDQVAAAERAGVRAVAINSTNAHEWSSLLASLAADEVDVLLVSPERLNNPSFRETQLPALVERLGMLVVDEAHCISDWGHDFRPDYRRLRDLIAAIPPDVPVLATTATANARVVADVAEQLGGSSVLTIRGPLARTSLRLGVLRLPDAKTRLGWLLSHLADLPGSGIIYTLTVSAAEDTARLLREAGLSVRAYTGQTDPAERESLEAALKANEVKALVATSALGMGFDKPDLGFVLHLGAPSSPVAYYQQVGRAGRATASADVLLLPGPEDRDIWQYFATASMPSQDRASRVLRELADGSVLSTPALEALVNVRRTQLELLLKVLDVDGAVRRVKGGWESTGRPWTYDAERYERIAAARTAEQDHMIEYERTSGCRMEFLQRSLDDETARPCGRCDSCAGAWYPVDVAPDASAEASRAIDRVGVPIEPRAQWPVGVADRLGVRGNIPVGERASEGRALARLTDLGWGNVLRSVFAAGAPDAPVTRAMLDGCVRVLAQWDWEERPTSVVAMPSRRRPLLVDSLARGLAEIGRLPYAGALCLVDGGPTGEAGGSSAFRLAGVWQRFDASMLELPPGPVLLVDDLASSRWTITVAARELRRCGASRVLPLLLATVA
ncbi:RecQ family ATP-dependent DNA helicase [Cellulomonas sp. URHD0024]|uniref:RecQ family ATP-dependent DNA helicase n=1 Tax=Cellulomonas sp. URHD0024 TaxID=1302620 RepID=UPI000410E2AB|nr:RecQ family ATP-dependent DNA helicase [Cellulomonas sp. URHD0024]